MNPQVKLMHVCETRLLWIRAEIVLQFRKQLLISHAAKNIGCLTKTDSMWLMVIISATFRTFKKQSVHYCLSHKHNWQRTYLGVSGYFDNKTARVDFWYIYTLHVDTCNLLQAVTGNVA